MISVNHDTLAAFSPLPNHNLCMGIGKALKAAREAKGLRQIDVAIACGWKDGQNRLSNYERDDREPSIDDLRKLAEVLGTTPGALIAGNGIDAIEDAMRLAAMLVTLSPEARMPLEAGIVEAYRRRGNKDELSTPPPVPQAPQAPQAPPAPPAPAQPDPYETVHMTKDEFARAIKKMGLGRKA